MGSIGDALEQETGLRIDMPRCALETCHHGGDRHHEAKAPGDGETVFPCLDCDCEDYEPEIGWEPPVMVH